MRIKTIVTMLIAGMLGTISMSAQQPGYAQMLPQGAQAIRQYGHLPMIFEANQGQTSGQVKFLSRGKGYTAFLTNGGMVLNLRTSSVKPVLPSANQSAPGSQATNTTLQFRLLGANKNPTVLGEDLQPGRVNYFLGNDPGQWHTNLPTYAKVRYKNIYPGIDLIYYGNHQQLEYDFAVAPGADPRQIQFEIKGASQTSIDNQGNLVLGAKNTQLHFQSPLVYQESAGKRTAIAGSYAMQDSSHVGFQVANYDASKPLVIDPVLVYSTYLGGSGTDQPSGIAVDSNGSVYIVGYTDSADFPLAALGSLPNNANHVFVAKLDPTGTNLVYANYIGGNNQDYGIALVLDNADNVYVTGSTASSDFPVVNSFQAQQPGPYAGFVTKISADGSSLVYSTYLGGNSFDQPTSIALDSLGEVHVAGYTTSLNFPVANAYQASASPNQGGAYGGYGFLTKLSSSGSSLVYSTYLGGSTDVVQNCGSPCWPSPYSTISGVAVDANGNAYVTGATNTSNFPVTLGAYQTVNSTQQDATLGFLSKFGSAGNIEYSTYFYGSSGSPLGIAAIAVDGSGSAYITGNAESDGTFPITSTGICDPGVYGFACSYAFVTKFDAAGSTLLYSTFLGPNNYASPQALSVDSSGDAYVLASVFGGSFQANDAVESYSGGADLLVVEIDPSASTQLFSTYLGGTGDEFPSGIALDATGNLYVTGSTDATDFPTTQGVLQNQLGGGTDAFVLKIGAASAPFVSLSPNSLEFAALSVGSTSQAQTVLLRNMGSSQLSITSITASGDFAESDTCGSSVPAAGSCTLSITFTPGAVGARSGSVVIQDNAAGAPHSIALSGVGEGGNSSSPAPNVVLTPAGLVFSSVPVGRSSIAQAITLTNAGNAGASLENFQMTGDYAQVNNCPSSLAAGSSCTINVVFTPTVAGSRNGTLTVLDNAQNSPQSLALSGTGSASNLVVGPTTLAFGSVGVGSSASQVVILSNSGNALVGISNIQITGDYAETNNCPSLLAGGSVCTIPVVFTPTTTGSRTGILTITDNSGAAQTTSLSGTGSDFALTTSSNQDTVQAGASASYTLSVAAVTGSFPDAISLSCTGLPANTTCSFSPAAVTPGASKATSTLTIATSQSTAENTPATPGRHKPIYAVWINLQGLGFLGMVVAKGKKRSSRAVILVLLIVAVLGMLCMSGCAGGTGIAPQTKPAAPTSHSYTITVTGTSGSLQHSLPLTLTVQ